MHAYNAPGSLWDRLASIRHCWLTFVVQQKFYRSSPPEHHKNRFVRRCLWWVLLVHRIPHLYVPWRSELGLQCSGAVWARLWTKTHSPHRYVWIWLKRCNRSLDRLYTYFWALSWRKVRGQVNWIINLFQLYLQFLKSIYVSLFNRKHTWHLLLLPMQRSLYKADYWLLRSVSRGLCCS